MSDAITVKHLHISHSGYDTHSNQRPSLTGLLTELDAAIGAFVQDLSIAGRFDDVVINIRSEFGRTFENASLGTDHGQGTTEILIGNRVRGGVASPDYTAADFAGNWVPVKFDSREVLEQMLIHHLNVDPGPVLPEAFNRIGLQLFQ